MGLFDSIQNIIGGVTESVSGSVGDSVGRLTEIPGVQELQDAAGGAVEAVTSVTDGATDAVTSVTEQGQTAIEDLTNNIGL